MAADDARRADGDAAERAEVRLQLANLLRAVATPEDPAGSTISNVAHYDNTASNKYNPAPDREVFWSEQSWDEMYQPFTEYSVDSQDLTVLKPITSQQQK